MQRLFSHLLTERPFSIHKRRDAWFRAGCRPFSEGTGGMPVRRIVGIIAIIAGVLSFICGSLGYLDGPLFAFAPASQTAPASHQRLAVVFLSGDMGLNVGIEPQVAAQLASNGIPVLSINSLYYFRVTRAPAEIERLIAGGIRRALVFGHADRVVLIGYSFGADMLHTGLASLPLALRGKVVMTALIVPSDTVQFRSSPSEVFSFMEPQYDALATARKLDWVPGLCIYGIREESSLCKQLTLPRFHSIGLPGGHLLHRDANAVYRELIDAINKVTNNSGSAHVPVKRGHAVQHFGASRSEIDT